MCKNHPQKSTLNEDFMIDQNIPLTLKRLGYFGGWTDWGDGPPPPPPLEISAVDCAIAAKIFTMVICDVIYKTVYLDFPKQFSFILY